ncbi:hypothetical protein DL762_009601 [Monosporascus cannonballus]|uniref:Peptidase S8/S53 domain-containing protein n=1 Tax=Monosporascus cannonballus TaxID=155416 RepID=A0ABY0GTS5_9PEZI|nr:hypothetical protein DL762_009601 [Monosporascus cannonballus]
MYQRALQGFEKTLGPHHTSTLDTVHNLGNLYADQVNNLGILYSDQGKPKEAEEMFQRAVQGYNAILGPNHHKTQRVLRNLQSLGQVEVEPQELLEEHQSPKTGPITLRPSFEALPTTVVVTGQDGKTTSRIIVPPPLSVPTAPRQDPNDPNQPGTTSPGQDPDHPVTDDPPEDEDDGDDTDPPVPFPWPSGTIEPVIDPKKPTPPGGHRVSCTAWFFLLYVSWDDLRIKVDFWDIILPPGGIGLNGQFPSVPPEPNPCERTTTKLTIESTSYGTTTTQGTVRTTTTPTFSREFSMVGCAVKDTSTTSTTTACDAPTKRAVAPIAEDEDSEFAELVIFPNAASYGIENTGMTIPVLQPPNGWTPSQRAAEDYYKAWAPSHICAAPGETWDRPIGGYLDRVSRKWKTTNSPVLQVYVIESKITPLDMRTANYGNWRASSITDIDRGTKVASMPNVLLVASGGNAKGNNNQTNEIALEAYPALLASEGALPNLIAVGATDKLGRRALFSKGSDDQVVYAPRKDVDVALAGGAQPKSKPHHFVTTHIIAGLVAYFRVLSGPLKSQLERPATVKVLVLKMRGALRGANDRSSPAAYTRRNNKYGRRVPSIWNGHLKKDVSCFVQMGAPGCPKIDLADRTPVSDSTLAKLATLAAAEAKVQEAAKDRQRQSLTAVGHPRLPVRPAAAPSSLVTGVDQTGQKASRLTSSTRPGCRGQHTFLVFRISPRTTHCQQTVSHQPRFQFATPPTQAKSAYIDAPPVDQQSGTLSHAAPSGGPDSIQLRLHHLVDAVRAGPRRRPDGLRHALALHCHLNQARRPPQADSLIRLP